MASIETWDSLEGKGFEHGIGDDIEDDFGLDWVIDNAKHHLKHSHFMSQIVDSAEREKYLADVQKYGELIERLSQEKVTCDFCDDELDAQRMYTDYQVLDDDERIMCKQCKSGRLLYLYRDRKQQKMELANIIAPLPFPFIFGKIFFAFLLWLRRIERCTVCGNRTDIWVLNEPIRKLYFNGRGYHEYCFVQKLFGAIDSLKTLEEYWTNPRTFYRSVGTGTSRVSPDLLKKGKKKPW